LPKKWGLAQGCLPPGVDAFWQTRKNFKSQVCWGNPPPTKKRCGGGKGPAVSKGRPKGQFKKPTSEGRFQIWDIFTKLGMGNKTTAHLGPTKETQGPPDRIPSRQKDQVHLKGERTKDQQTRTSLSGWANLKKVREARMS